MPYIGTSPSNGVRRVHTYTATASQTTFSGASSEGITLSYADTNYLDVFQNGVLLGSADYTSTSGTSVVLAQGASADDLVVIVVYDIFSVADTVSKANGGSFDGNVTIGGTLGVTGASTFTGSVTGTTATFSTADNDPQLTLISTDADANEGPVIDLKRNSASPADDDNGPRIKFTGKNDAGEDVEYTRVRFNIQDMTDGTEDGQMDIATMINGSLQNRVFINDTGVTINDVGLDSDFRVESDGDTNMINVDGGNNNLGVGTVPDSNRKLHVKSARSGSFNTMIDMTASSGNIFALDIFLSGQAPDNTSSEFIRCRDTGQIRFKVLSNGNAQNANNVYGAISDIKLKEQITDASSQWEDIKALKVRQYKMKDDVAKGDSDSHWRLGVIAQELETANMNGLVDDNPDLIEKENKDGKIELVDSGTVTKSVKYSILYMKAVKALQEAMARIETLEAEVKALKGK